MVQTGVADDSMLLYEISDRHWNYGLDINLTTAFMVTRTAGRD